MTNLRVVPLLASSFRRPISKTPQLLAVLPTQFHEFLCVEIGSFFAEEGFKAPLQVRTGPGFPSVSARNDPVITKQIPHVLLIVLCA